MADKHEMSMFMKELRRLLYDYKTCDKEFFKKKISEDILLLGSIVYENQIGYGNTMYQKAIYEHEPAKEMGHS
ncbi:hypothetical protein [Fictibacillus fluitans]|uniref:Uncharacterized protein n=1 Tax=Fictibacillus fluitans TaxID=3058422 RepID=A0ABT8I3Z6_9BACL|nr:hypothetical protein [Fictibacillus sp. NE201]MDN4527693.1 hypothetical protein [Fictibacillus sp. NE201]